MRVYPPASLPLVVTFYLPTPFLALPLVVTIWYRPPELLSCC